MKPPKQRTIGKDVTLFWLDGTLAISADEQISFLEKLSRNHLPLSPRSTEIVKEILILDRKKGRIFSGKTGSGYKNGKFFFRAEIWSPNIQV